MTDFYFVMEQTFYFFIPLLIVALGGMFAEKSGIVNIALEGIMIIGAFTGVLFLNIMTNNGILVGQPQLLLLLAIFVAALFGSIFSMLLAYASINMKANQVIGGTALNLLAPAIAVYVARLIFTAKQVPFSGQFQISKVPILGDIPFIGPLLFQNVYIFTYIGIIVIIASIIILYTTRFGLRLSACGEHPHAAESVGVNVYHMRWAGVMISGALAGLGGLALIVPTQVSFDGHIGGYGFLALAVMIFGQWKPKRILLAALFFGFFKALAPILSTTVSASLSYVLKMVPYIATMIALALTSKKSRAPKAEGIPFESGGK